MLYRQNISYSLVWFVGLKSDKTIQVEFVELVGEKKEIKYVL